MANKQNFTPDEWTKVLESIMLAGVAVSAAEPSGLWGTIKEGFASSSEIAKAQLDPGTNEGSLPASEGANEVCRRDWERSIPRDFS